MTKRPKPSQLDNNLNERHVLVFEQRGGYLRGDGLQRHIAAAHGGVFDLECPACRETIAKQRRVQASGGRGAHFENNKRGA